MPCATNLCPVVDTSSGLKVLDNADFRVRVATVIDSFIADHRAVVAATNTNVLPLIDSLATMMASGKRLRPAFAYWGYRAVGGSDSNALIRAATGLEFVQASALIHDDVIDNSDSRRGLPSIHRQFETLHKESMWNGSAEQFGIGAAVLLGDLSLSWADELIYQSGLSTAELSRGKAIYDIMRTELMIGQYLDTLEQARQTADIDTIRQVMIHKSAKYTIERPLHFGAAMAGGSEEQLTALTHYGIPLGVAFQLRDDVLGVFGNPEETGKPAGDDLREGKRTMLIARTLHACSETAAQHLQQSLGNPNLTDNDIAELRDIIVSSGALDVVETDIARGLDVSLAALNEAPFSDEAIVVLSNLAVGATQRIH
jgi:geranylgeranyl diphosphate synthase type I